MAKRQRIALGFDGSMTGDFTVIRAETDKGLLFTPTFGPDSRPTIWDPADHGGQIPRDQVSTAVDELFRTYDVGRMLCDPPLWQSEIQGWQELYGDGVVMLFQTYNVKVMHNALERFTSDLSTGALTHDNCPTTSEHVANARRASKMGGSGRYILEKGSSSQKIDAAVASVIAHESASHCKKLYWQKRRTVVQFI
jgi:hypothetical protein